MAAERAGIEPASQQMARSGRLLIVALVALPALACRGTNKVQHEAGTQNGAAAPAFKLARYSGGTVSLEDLRGKVVMLNFWATWCVPCVAEMPTLTKLASEYQSKGLVFLAANLDEPETAPAQVRVFVAQSAPDLENSVVFADDRMTMSYDVQDLPTLYLIGRDGRILESYAGYASESLLRRKIESALGK
jgi:thiol-disulfide isomerase/thioredoxin